MALTNHELSSVVTGKEEKSEGFFGQTKYNQNLDEPLCTRKQNSIRLWLSFYLTEKLK